MAGLQREDYEGLMALAEAVISSSRAAEWWEAYVALALGPLLHADVVAIAVLDYTAATRGTFSMIRPRWAEIAVPSGSAMHQDLLDAHPFTDYIRGPGPHPAVRVSDLLPETRWRNMAGYSKMRELIGATYQVSVAVRTTRTRSLAASPVRAGRDFTERELEVCARLQTLLAAADRHSETVADQRRARSEADLVAADDVAAHLGLTSRERVVLGLLAGGHTARSAARTLLVSPRTVSKHQQNLYRKLGVSDRLAAVLRAKQHGLLD